MRKTVRRPEIIELPRRSLSRMPGHVIGRLVRWSRQGPEVTFVGNPHGPMLARLGASVSMRELRSGAATPELLLVFEEERSDRPIVVAVLRPAASVVDQQACATPGEPADAVVDGTRVVIEARDEIEFRCGQASVTLRRNGRIVIRGSYVETRAEGVNRIQGGSVQIN